MEFQSTPFDPHAKILKHGQYDIRKEDNIKVPIRVFHSDEDEELSVSQRIDQMKEEISAYETQMEERKRQEKENTERRLTQVRDEARKVMEDAEQHAFDRIQKSVAEKENLLRQSKDEADKIIRQAQNQSDEMIFTAKKEADKLKKEAQEEGYEEGRSKGYEGSRQDISHVVERLHSVVAETARERERILMHSEQQVINLVLTMVQKIVKKLAIEHRDVVIENAKAALALLRSAMTLFIRVSPRDFNLLAAQKDELIRLIESKGDVKFIEDPTLQPGGVYIESDAGDIDATINGQLEELEREMRFYVPLKPRTPKEEKQSDTPALAEVSSPPQATPFAQNQPSYGQDIPQEMRYTQNLEDSPVIQPLSPDTAPPVITAEIEPDIPEGFVTQ